MFPLSRSLGVFNTRFSQVGAAKLFLPSANYAAWYTQSKTNSLKNTVGLKSTSNAQSRIAKLNN
ncbi:hypothetical protein SAMN02745177_01702 [Desulforamulus hydrothermalis Lam5 = DSM 18033]|nr:hypothetical protein SAMN02745177_01702 [Desulforamulus hydrothermalis Lam5 = DSM 18033]